MGPFPLFDSGYMFWRGDVDAMVDGRLGVGLDALGIPERELMARYNSGTSPVRVADDIAFRLQVAAE
jgi:hypothetical protein